MITIIVLVCLYIICSTLSTMCFYGQTYGVSKEQLLKINYHTELHIFIRFLLFSPLYWLWYVISNFIFTIAYCGLDDPGIALLVADQPTQLWHITVTTLPILLFILFQAPLYKRKAIYSQIQKSSLKFTTQKNREYFENMWLTIYKMGNFIFIILTYLCLLFPIYRLPYVPKNSLRAIPVHHYRWSFVSGRNNLHAVLKQGKSFSCDYFKEALITTEGQCRRCPNRKWTGQTCILKQCPPEAPIMAVDPNFRDNRGTYCRTCEIIDNVGYFHTATPDECFKCPNVRKNWSSWNSTFNSYHCILN